MMDFIHKEITRRLGQLRFPFFGKVAREGSTLQVSGMTDEMLEDIQVIQQVGMASWLPKGSRVVLVPLMGGTNRVIVIASDSAPVMMTPNEGETCIWDQFDHHIVLGASGINIKGKTTIDGPVTTTDNLVVGTGATGSFTTPSGQVVTVADGIVISIE